MHAPSAAEFRDLPLLEIIDLKWLLASEGLHLHVEHLQYDPVYAARILELAAASPNDALRAAAERVRGRLAAAG